MLPFHHKPPQGGDRKSARMQDGETARKPAPGVGRQDSGEEGGQRLPKKAAHARRLARPAPVVEDTEYETVHHDQEPDYLAASVGRRPPN